MNAVCPENKTSPQSGGSPGVSSIRCTVRCHTSGHGATRLYAPSASSTNSSWQRGDGSGSMVDSTASPRSALMTPTRNAQR
eukprot:CAMPEP_0185855364 /NCGR_PEP_ID=MMETSP1354-20130828/25449_1 /TAXON_ID=708628 /ORGANISM="Erythrolobus madagascarensis, Strain CCMP3276" /LENGTH=80 /DNA_ID=CAMNT_0028557377 /DNA_START=124 /DNA_END=362 /DNA_ORIENTATION=+